MEHRQFIELYLSAEVDGELTGSERQAVIAHLADCTDCRQSVTTERALKSLVRQGLPILPTPPDLRHSIIAALDRETARTIVKPARKTRRPLWVGSIAALAAAAAVIAVIIIRGTAPPPNRTFEAAITDYLQSEQRFTASTGLQSLDSVAMALANEFGYPYVWDFSSLGLTLVGARFEHLPGGKVMAYSLYKGSRGSILCINFRQLDYSPPPGGEELHGVRFYRYKDLWIGVVRYSTVFCLLVSRFTPSQLTPALTVGAPKTTASALIPAPVVSGRG